MTLATAATNAVSGGKATVATDDTAAITSAITAACTKNGAVYVPRGYYGIQGLTIPCAMRLYGESVTTTAAGTGENVILAPYLLGSVLWQMKPNTDAVKTTVSQIGVNIDTLGVVFDPTLAFWQTGFGFNGSATDPNPGILNAVWHDLMVWGNDGNHYAFSLTNSNLWNGHNFFSYGGGGLNMNSTTNALCCAGNSDIGAIYTSLLAGGTASGVNVTGTGTYLENLIDFRRMEVNQNDPATTFSGWPIPRPYTADANAQQLVNIPSNIKFVTVVSADIEPLNGGTFTLPYNQSSRILNLTGVSNPAWIPVQGQPATIDSLVGISQFYDNPLTPLPAFSIFDGNQVAIGNINSTTGVSGRGILMGSNFNDGIILVNGGNVIYIMHLTNTAASILMTIDGTTGAVTIPNVKSTTGTRYVCADTGGKLVSQTTACSGT
jgi:hypothetical protein